MTPRAGWIFHERVQIRLVPYPGAGHYTTQTRERWWVVDDVCRSRDIYYPMLSMKPVESSVDERAGSIRVSVYDPSTQTAYSGPSDTCGSTGVEKGDAAQRFRQQVEQGVWRRVGTTRIRGRLAYEIVPASQLDKTVMYVDAETYAPLRWVTPGFSLTQRGGPQKQSCHSNEIAQHPLSKTTYDVLEYEYLPPTPENLRLLSTEQNRKIKQTKQLAMLPPKLKDPLALCGHPSPLPSP